jgi:hypothetical protein
LIVPNDRPCDKLREKGHEKGIMGKGVLPSFSLGTVDKIGDLLKGEEGDPQGQKDILRRPTPSGEGSKIRHKEIGILKIGYKSQIDCYPGKEPDSLRFFGVHVPLDDPSPSVVKEYRKENEKDKRRIPIGIKDQRAHRENSQSHIGYPHGTGKAKENPRYGKKQE